MNSNEITINWEALRDCLDKYQASQPKQGICPNCGYCPHCGRSASPWYPTYPYYPQPYWAPYTISYMVDNTYNDGHIVTCNHG